MDTGRSGYRTAKIYGCVPTDLLRGGRMKSRNAPRGRELRALVAMCSSWRSGGALTGPSGPSTWADCPGRHEKLSPMRVCTYHCPMMSAMYVANVCQRGWGWCCRTCPDRGDSRRPQPLRHTRLRMPKGTSKATCTDIARAISTAWRRG